MEWGFSVYSVGLWGVVGVCGAILSKVQRVRCTASGERSSLWEGGGSSGGTLLKTERLTGSFWIKI